MYGICELELRRWGGWMGLMHTVLEILEVIDVKALQI